MLDNMFDVFVVQCAMRTGGVRFRLSLGCEYFYEEAKGLLSVHESVGK